MDLRIKEIRKSLGMSQVQFAEALKVSLQNIKFYETGRRNPSDAFIQLVCNKYNINETWLRTGDGEMHGSETREQEIARITMNLLNDDSDFKLMLTKIIANLTPEQIEVLKQVAMAFKQEEEKNKEED